MDCMNCAYCMCREHFLTGERICYCGMTDEYIADTYDAANECEYYEEDDE